MKYIKIVGPLFLLILLGLLANDFRSKQPYGYYRSPVWADKAGYYVYLPFVFNYNGVADSVPATVYEDTGLCIFKKDSKLITKYPIGVAYMEFPFFLAARIIDYVRTSGQISNAFDGIYVKWLVWAPPIYVSIGLYLLFLSLRLLNIKPTASIVSILFLAFGTSLFYYTIIEGLMSHSFSFSLFSLFTYCWLKLTKGSTHKSLLFLLALCIGLVFVVRPFNVLLIVLYSFALQFITKTSFSVIIGQLYRLLPWLIPILIILVLPQLFYYKYAYGSWIVYSYGQEGFNFLSPYGEERFNFLSPEFVNMLFSPKAGIFVYVPAMILLVFALFVKGFNQPREYGPLVLFIVVITYVLSSWHSWSFGCGFGIRPYVELLPILVIPFATWLNKWTKKKRVVVLFMMLVTFYNIRMTYQWSGCWFGKEETFAEYFLMFWT